MYQSYVYRVTSKVTGQFYIGSRTENVSKCRFPEDDLWKHYFTSSKKVKQMIEEYGLDSFNVEILSKFDSYSECFWEEQRLIVESKNNPLRLNKAYVNPETGKTVLTSFNETEEQKIARMQKMSETKKGKFNSNGHYGLKHTEETKQRMREAQAKLAYSHSEEVREKMRGRIMTQEQKDQISLAKKGKPWTEARRQAQLNRKGKSI